MQQRENEKRGYIRFTAEDISLMANMLEKVSSTIDIMYFLMERKMERSFVVMLMSVQNIDLKSLIRREKRDTDIMFEVDKGESLYLIICQDTKIDGGYHFAKRLVEKSEEEGGEEIYCTELEITATTYKIEYIVYRLMERYRQHKEEKSAREITFKTLN